VKCFEATYQCNFNDVIYAETATYKALVLKVAAIVLIVHVAANPFECHHLKWATVLLEYLDYVHCTFFDLMLYAIKSS